MFSDAFSSRGGLHRLSKPMPLVLGSPLDLEMDQPQAHCASDAGSKHFSLLVPHRDCVPLFHS